MGVAAMGATGRMQKRSKRSLLKGMTNLQKKLWELCVLCGIEAFLIYSSSPSDKLQTWPADPKAMEVLIKKFKPLPRRDESKKARRAAAGEQTTDEAEDDEEEEMVVMEESGDGGLDHEVLSVIDDEYQEQAVSTGLNSVNGVDGFLDLSLALPNVVIEKGDKADLANTTLCLAKAEY